MLLFTCQSIISSFYAHVSVTKRCLFLETLLYPFSIQYHSLFVVNLLYVLTFLMICWSLYSRICSSSSPTASVLFFLETVRGIQAGIIFFSFCVVKIFPIIDRYDITLKLLSIVCFWSPFRLSYFFSFFIDSGMLVLQAIYSVAETICCRETWIFRTTINVC